MSEKTFTPNVAQINAANAQINAANAANAARENAQINAANAARANINGDDDYFGLDDNSSAHPQSFSSGLESPVDYGNDTRASTYHPNVTSTEQAQQSKNTTTGGKKRKSKKRKSKKSRKSRKRKSRKSRKRKSRK